MKAVNAVVAVVAALMLMPTLAEARSRSARTGFNFGTTIRILNDQERTHAGEGSDKNTRFKSDSQLVNPYLGYSFGSFNLGLMYSAESRSSESIEVSEDGSKTVSRNTEANGKGVSVFSRFLFGGVFFFEGGFGLYQDRATVKTQEKQDQGGTAFTGEEDSYVVKGTGPGYHVGGGLELPIDNGFYFTACYQARMVQLRDYNGGSDLGRKRSQDQKREVLFGIAYYDR